MSEQDKEARRAHLQQMLEHLEEELDDLREDYEATEGSAVSEMLDGQMANVAFDIKAVKSQLEAIE